MSKESKQIRILFVDHTPFIGGAELVLISHIRSLAKDSPRHSALYKPVVVCSDVVPELIAKYKDAGAEVLVIPFGKLKSFNPLVLFRLLRTLSELNSCIRRQGIDLVVSNTERAMYPATIAALLTRTPLIWWIRDFEYNRILFRLLLFVPRKVICVSKAIRDYYSGKSNPKFKVVYVASDFDEKLEKISKDSVTAVRKELGVEESDFVVGFVGRLVKWKGSQVLLEAARNLTSYISNLKIIIVGSGEGQEGSIEANLKERIAKEGLEGTVILTGQREDVPVLMNIFDVFCHTSIEPEPFATVVVEAMIAGLPVIGTSIGGTPEIIKDGENGFLVPPGDSAALAEVLRNLRNRAGLRRRVGQKAKETALSGYTEDIITRQVERVYKEVLQ